MLDIGNGVQLVTRSEWGALAPRSTSRLTSRTNTDHWEGPSMGVFPHESCPAKVRAIQRYHMDHNGWSDIAYNTLSCPHGYVFEGRGRGRRSAANGTTAGNSGSFADCYLGGVGDPFTEAGKRAKRQAGIWLAGEGGPRRCHRDWKTTACPGDTICAWTHAGQPTDRPAPTPVPTPTPSPIRRPPTVYAFQAPDRPVAVCSDSGSVTLYGAAALTAKFRKAGDDVRPDEEFWAQAVAGAFVGCPAVSARQWDVAAEAARQRR